MYAKYQVSASNHSTVMSDSRQTDIKQTDSIKTIYLDDSIRWYKKYFTKEYIGSVLFTAKHAFKKSSSFSATLRYKAFTKITFLHIYVSFSPTYRNSKILWGKRCIISICWYEHKFCITLQCFTIFCSNELVLSI